MGSVTEKALYLNLGYWTGSTADADEASESLVMLMADWADLSASDEVLDVGYGFGDQDILWSQRCGPRRIVGLNPTASQVEVAQRRVSDLGLEERIDLRLGSATRMSIPDASVDRVMALECAFHFDTREDFFREAWRVLRPGGRLVTADILPMPTAEGRKARALQRLSWGMMANKFAVPDANVYGIEGYRERLVAQGFDSIRIESIRDRVYAPMHAYLREHPQSLRRLHPLARAVARMSLRLDPESVYSGLDYVMASGVKR
ncbi:class I SAM-dependent methyltransferase [Imhoffiella purpurea]|nr:class I SAM-dependent methyltransferase [Imhoffiella purpurea]